MPQDSLVLGRGYESGYDASEQVFRQSVAHCPGNSWYDGKYQDAPYDEYKYADTDAVIIV